MYFSMKNLDIEVVCALVHLPLIKLFLISLFIALMTQFQSTGVTSFYVEV